MFPKVVGKKWREQVMMENLKEPAEGTYITHVDLDKLF